MSDEIDEDQVGGLGVDPVRDAITQVDLGAEMQRSYLDYAMSVIVSRALPDARDGMKPVHRRIVYAMWNGGYRPDRAFSKCAKVVGDVMGNYHPHGDTSIYDALVRLVQPWNLRYPLAQGQGNFGSAGNDGAAAPRYTETKMAPLAMEMVRDIDQDSVDMMENYDGTELEPVVLPSRFPSLLANGSSGIAVGMATNIPPHNLREVADAVRWFLDNPEASREELLEASMERIKGPDFPNGAKILGRSGIEDAFRTGRGSITQRAEVSTEEIGGRMCLVITELPYQVNPDALANKIADMVKTGRLAGIADIRDETSGRTGQRLVLVLKRDAVPKVVLNNLYKHTQLQENFSANMLALVDGTPRTLSLDMFVRAWVDHQVEVIVRRTQYRLRRAEEQMHIQRGLLLAINALDQVIATIRGSQSTDDARQGLISLLGVDETQANAILALQLRRLAALERLKIQADYDELAAQVEDYKDIIATPERQRTIIADELGEIVERFGDERRTRIVPFDGEVADEDLIPEEQVVVTITRGGYAKRTREDQYRLQKRGGKGVRGASLRGDDVVDHFFTSSTHRWLLFFTNFGRVYRAKAYELPEASRDSKGQHVANLLAFQPGESIAGVLALQDFQAAEYLVLATRHGVVKKTALSAFDSNRSGGVIAINLRDRTGSDGTNYPDELVGATLANSDDHIILVSHQGQSVRFEATDEALRPMGRATSGVTGMKFREGDWLLTMARIVADSYLVTLTEGGYAKRTSVDEYRVQKRGGLGTKAAKLSEDRGGLVGALIVEENDEIMVVMQKGKVVRSRVTDVPAKGRDTMGVVFAKPDKGDQIIAVTHSSESIEEDEDETDADGTQAGAEPGAGDGATAGIDADGADQRAPDDALESDQSADVDDDGEAPSDPSQA